MANWRRRVADLVERASGARIVRPRDLPVLYEQDFLRRFLREFAVDTVFDVGGNQGQYARMLRQRAEFTGTIVTFEPVPHLADHLRWQSRSDDRWFIEQVALDAVEGTATFNVMRNDEFSSLLMPSDNQLPILARKNEIVDRVEVRTDTVENVFEELRGRVNLGRSFLKLDTQGNDTRIVQGAGGTIREFVGLQSELSIRPIYDHAPRFTEAIAFYESLGFRPSAIFPNNTGNFPDMIEMDCVMYRPESREITPGH